MDDELGRLRAANAELEDLNAQLGRALTRAEAGSEPQSTVTAATTLAQLRRALVAAEAERDALQGDRDACAAMLADLRTLHADLQAAYGRMEAYAQAGDAERGQLWARVHQAESELQTARAGLEEARARHHEAQQRLGALQQRVAVRIALGVARAAAPAWLRSRGTSRG